MFRKCVLLLNGMLLGTAVLAQTLPMDTDGDGAVSLSELQAVRPQITAQRFSELDADNNGLLSTEELRSARQMRQRPRERFRERVDSDGDGAVSFDELQAVRPGITPEQFARMDANSDGLITPDERRGRGRRPFGGPGPRRRCGESPCGPDPESQDVL